MLVKLLKFELKAMSRYLLPLYTVILLFTIAFSLIYNTSFVHTFLSDNFYDFSRIILIVFYVAIIFAMEIVTFIVTAKRMYTNLLGVDGYLMNTIPVKTSDNLLCKTISAVIWNLIATVIFCASVIVIICSNMSFEEIFARLTEIFQKVSEAEIILQGDFYLYIFELAAYLILAEIAGTLLIYASICVGHLFTRKILGSICGFILGKVIILGIATVIDYLIFGNNFQNSVTLNSIEDLKNGFYFHGTLISSNLLNIFITISCFYISKYILQNEMNLE